MDPLNFNRPKRPAVSARAGKQRGYDIRNAAANEAEIYIYGCIGDWDTMADQFVRDLATITAPTINVRINSPGGDVFEGVTIYNALLRHEARIVTHVDGLAASAASFIAMAGDEVRMGQGSFLMIHNASSFAYGDSEDLRNTADLLDQVNVSIAGIYAAAAGGDKDAKYFLKKMDAETWYTAEEAVAEGLADAVEGAAPPADAPPTNRFDLSVFAHVPEPLKAATKAAAAANLNPPKIENVRDAERLLRDAGLPRAAAKKGAPALLNALSDLRDADGESYTAVRAFLSAWKW